jgi:copper chaperone CopZ
MTELNDASPLSPVAGAERASYTVTGMTCGHCAQAVTAELNKLTGVTKVEIDVPTGRVNVTSENPLAEAHVRASVEEAGYQLAAPAAV